MKFGKIAVLITALLAMAIPTMASSVDVVAGLSNTEYGQVATIELIKNTPALSMSAEYASTFELFGQKDGDFKRMGLSVFKLLPATFGDNDKLSAGIGAGVYNLNGIENGWSTGLYGVARVDMGNYFMQVKYLDIRDSSVSDGWVVAIGKSF